jgi:Na+-driven multidrug efflux pump
VKYCAISGVLLAWCFVPPGTWLLAHELGLGAQGGWIALIFELAVGSVLYWHRLVRGRWLEAASKARALTGAPEKQLLQDETQAAGCAA